jgi:hypothetical protein
LSSRCRQLNLNLLRTQFSQQLVQSRDISRRSGDLSFGVNRKVPEFGQPLLAISLVQVGVPLDARLRFEFMDAAEKDLAVRLRLEENAVPAAVLQEHRPHSRPGIIDIIFLERGPFYTQLVSDFVGFIDRHLYLVLGATHTAAKTRQSFLNHIYLDNTSVWLLYSFGFAQDKLVSWNFGMLPPPRPTMLY